MSRDYPYYLIDGIQYPRVTSVLNYVRIPSPGGTSHLERWRGDVGNEEAERIVREACDIGIDIHDYAEQYNKGIEVYVPDPYIEMFESYVEWFDYAVDEILPDPLGVELTVCSKRFFYAGTTDLVARLKGDQLYSIIDLKTSNTVSPTAALQLAAYRQALIEMGIPVHRRLVLKIDKIQRGKEAKPTEYKNHDRDFNAFQAAIVLWRYYETK